MLLIFITCAPDILCISALNSEFKSSIIIWNLSFVGLGYTFQDISRGLVVDVASENTKRKSTNEVAAGVTHSVWLKFEFKLKFRPKS